jgi:hypothetical protein
MRTRLPFRLVVAGEYTKARSCPEVLVHLQPLQPLQPLHPQVSLSWKCKEEEEDDDDDETIAHKL